MKILLKHKRWINRGENLANALKALTGVLQKQSLAVKKPQTTANEKTPQAYKSLHGSHS